MDPSNGGGRVPRQQPGPDLSTIPPPSRIDAIIAPGRPAHPAVLVSKHDELPASRIPCKGPARLLWLETFQLAMEYDAAATRAAMASEGWADGDARDAYCDWLHRVVDAAVDWGWPA